MPTDLETHFRKYQDLASKLIRAILEHNVAFKFVDIPGTPDYGYFTPLFFSPDALLSHDLNGIINFYNLAAQNVFDYTPEEIIGMPSVELVPEELRPCRAEKFRYIIEQRTSAQVQEVRLAKGNKPIDVGASVFPYEIGPKLSITAKVELI